MILVKDECNKKFLKDLYKNCAAFSIFSKTASKEISKRTSVMTNRIVVKLSEKETISGERLEFIYLKQPDGLYCYKGYRQIDIV